MSLYRKGMVCKPFGSEVRYRFYHFVLKLGIVCTLTSTIRYCSRKKLLL